MTVRHPHARRLIVAFIFSATFTATLVATASAEAAGGASCMGQEASAVSPPGSSDEIPTGMLGLRDFVDATFPGVPRGAIFSTIARLHAESHEACDEALE